MNNIKLTDVQQTKAIFNFKNTKEKHCRINSDISKNKICEGE